MMLLKQVESIDAAALVIGTTRRVLRTEAKAILTRADDLPVDLVCVVELIMSARGQVILSGIGKSGDIARKIAATLSSTGIPAHFVRVGAASRGDLGSITGNDICILLSNSGETSELSDLIAHTRRFSIALVGMTEMGVGVVGVVQDGFLIGTITDGDLSPNKDGLMARTARKVATLSPLTANAAKLAAEAVALMNQLKTHMLSVVDQHRRPLGILHIHDCLRAGVA